MTEELSEFIKSLNPINIEDLILDNLSEMEENIKIAKFKIKKYKGNKTIIRLTLQKVIYCSNALVKDLEHLEQEKEKEGKKHE